MSRPDWPEFFFDIATQLATRSTCDRLKVGCVLVSIDQHILCCGYNGSLKGAPHCDDVGHLIDNAGCVRTVHAEQNAIADAAKRGISVNGATAYTTHSPCRACAYLLVQAGVKVIRYRYEYRLSMHLEELRALGLIVELIPRA